jgi:hypothetical protein
MDENFEGVFRFTNATDEDFKVLWNNIEYTYPAHSTVPMIIPNESQENIQEIRKKFAYKLAIREFYKGKEYQKMSKMGGGIPPTFDEKLLQPWIDQCLLPLPKAVAQVKVLPKDSDKRYKGSKAIKEKSNLNYEFKDEDVVPIGMQSDKE